jgi:hypothetical protein
LSPAIQTSASSRTIKVIEIRALGRADGAVVRSNGVELNVLSLAIAVDSQSHLTVGLRQAL